MLVKRYDPLFAEWTSGGLSLVAPADATSRLTLGAGVLGAITGLNDWTPLEALRASLVASGASEQKATTIIEVLAEHQVIMRQPSVGEQAVPVEQPVPEPWTKWGTIAMLYHRHSRNASYFADLEAKRAYLKKITAHPAPALSKRYDGSERLALPSERARVPMPLDDVLMTRRTHRYFTGEPLALRDFSTLLSLVFGPQKFVDGKDFGILQLRTSPNAGARHEIECYAAVFSVDGVPPGLYHYDAMSHALELIGQDLTRARISDLLYGAPMADSAPVVFFTTAVTERIAYKYHHGRTYRLWMYNVGHVGQTFALTATGLGLGPFQTAAFRDTDADQLLGIDGNSEFVTYVLGCGHVAKLGSPPDIELADSPYT